MTFNYQNGTTPENVYCDIDCTSKIGTLSPHEQCDALGMIENKVVVLYNISGTNNFKIGFVKYTKGVKI